LVRGWVAAGAVIVAGSTLAGCGDGTSVVASNNVERPVVRVGALDDPMSMYLGELYNQVALGLGYRVPADGVQLFGSDRALADALAAGEVDLAPVSIASMIEGVTSDAQVATNQSEFNREELADLLGDEFDVREPSEAVHGYVAVVTPTFVDAFAADFDALDELSPELKWGGPEGCFDIAEDGDGSVHFATCGASYVRRYNQIISDTSSVYESDEEALDALALGKIQIAVISSTNPVLIEREGVDPRFIILGDASGIQPVDAVTTVGRASVLDRDLAPALDTVTASLTTESLREIAGALEEGQDPQVLAACSAAALGLAQSPAQGCLSSSAE
jgi:glycine betaine/choline ABC-type transport system substrate-binding protein